VEAPDKEDEEEFEEQIRVYQQKPFMRKLRFELAPMFSASFNDTLTHHISVGAVANFHVTDWLFIGGSYQKFFQTESAVFDEVQDSFGVFPERKFRDWYAGGHIGYVPLYGKFILFDAAIVNYDAYLIAGAGVTRTYTIGVEGENRVTGNIGIGTRLFITQWLTWNFEVRDYIYSEEFKAGDSLVNNVTFHTGLSFFFPFKYNYRYAK
jgi:outer membrane beta-barrel protein